LIAALAGARRVGAFDGDAHVGDRSRTRTTLAPLVAAALGRDGSVRRTDAHATAIDILNRERFGAWSALVAVSGTRARVADGLSHLRRHVRGFADVRVLDDRRIAFARALLGCLRPFAWARRKAALLEATAPLYGLTKGIPTDAAIASVEYAAESHDATRGAHGRAEVTGTLGAERAVDPDRGTAGMLYCLPLMPLTGEAATATRAALHEVTYGHGVSPSVTFNVLDARVLEAVVTLPFSRSDRVACERAHRCKEALHRRFRDLGFSLYRTDVDGMSDVVDESDPFWRLVGDLEDTFDPHGILSPRRYNPK
jgi:4-cresol dehydrogenase (hydroxylating) flavoprotein subunit